MSVVLQEFKKSRLFSGILRKLLAEQPELNKKAKRKSAPQDYRFQYFSNDFSSNNALMKLMLCEVKQVFDDQHFGMKTDIFKNLYRNEEIYYIKIDERYLEDICHQTFR